MRLPLNYYEEIISQYNFSTLARAHGVLRRNVRLDLMLGSTWKHLMRTYSPIFSQPKCATSSPRMISRVLFWSGLGMVILNPLNYHLSKL